MNYKKTTLPNGLRIITVPMKGNPAATVMVMVETGSDYEKKEENGLSHFIEHMCFKATDRRPNSSIIYRELDGLGAQSNAFTGNEYTGYFAKAEKKQWKKLLDVLSDMYLHPTFPAAELEKERGVILQEISMYEDQPQYQVRDLLHTLVYGDTPAGRSVSGTKENVKAFTREDFVRYRNEHYTAAKTIVVVAGDFKESEIKKEVAAAFAPIMKSKSPKKPKVEGVQIAPALVVKKRETDQMHLVFGLRSFKATDKRSAAVSMLTSLLGSGFSSRLFNKLREEMGVCYYVYSQNERSTDHGLFTISSGIDQTRVVEVVQVILDECKKLTEELVSEEELTRVKDYIVGNMYLGLEGTDDLAEFFVLQEVLRGEMRAPKETEKLLRAVTPGEIRKVARDIFKNENLNLAIIGKLEDEAEVRKVLRF